MQSKMLWLIVVLFWSHLTNILVKKIMEIINQLRFVRLSFNRYRTIMNNITPLFPTLIGRSHGIKLTSKRDFRQQLGDFESNVYTSVNKVFYILAY